MAQQPEVAAPGGWLCINGMFGTERAIKLLVETPKLKRNSRTVKIVQVSL